MMEILGNFPKEYSTVGTNSNKFVNQSGVLNNFPNLNYVEIEDLLINLHSVDP